MSAARRQTEPHQLPAVVGFRYYARFEHRDLSQNQQRLYLLAWQPLLWGGGMLV